MKSLREIVESSPRMRAAVSHGLHPEQTPQPLGSSRWDWADVNRVLVIRLRSIGDTVLTTPSLIALRRFLPKVQLDVLLESWVAPVLEGFEHIDHVVRLERGSTTARLQLAREIRAANYDVVYNLHGGTTATLLSRATGARHRVGFAHYQYSRLHNHLAPSSLELWSVPKAHSVEQQLALIGWTGVPVSDKPGTQLTVTGSAAASTSSKLSAAGIQDGTRFAMIHPAAAFATKQWAVEKYARVVDALHDLGLASVALAAPSEAALLNELKNKSAAHLVTLSDLSLPEVTALASRARLFVGNDSGIAHIAAAVNAPSVVIFGSSNVAHWRPWSNAAAEVVLEEMDCQPCHGYFCEKFSQPECILRVPGHRVIAAIERVVKESA
ncbi:MAG TPA: glycosyltransferase family 9 protein [Pyrinomonadaceae bacterium]|jgi:predicted lipopolysaccharide heptosyltransferase III|nr:glycosyltransferase family 9 protein [Pyrinomonadaceae bacterium]